MSDAFLLHQGRSPLSPITGEFHKRPHLASKWTRVLKEASFPGKPAFARTKRTCVGSQQTLTRFMSPAVLVFPFLVEHRRARFTHTVGK